MYDLRERVTDLEAWKARVDQDLLLNRTGTLVQQIRHSTLRIVNNRIIIHPKRQDLRRQKSNQVFKLNAETGKPERRDKRTS